MKTEANGQNDHPFVKSPHKTLLSMSVPVLLSLVAEPLTGLVDTAFVVRLGAESLAALGVGTVTLSGIFWIFNFLGIGTQTEVAQAYGRQEFNVTREAGGSALVLGVLIGIVLVVVGLPFVPYVSKVMGASGAVYDLSSQYIQIRLFGAPAVLLTIAAFGIFRGMQDMRTPFWVAISINTLNIILDPLLIFGYGPFPRLGVFGAGLASTVSQWVGAGCLVWVIHKRIGIPNRIRPRDVIKLFKIGRDLFIRTGGEQRISNFLLWQLAYTELYFTDTLWPDFDENSLEQAFDAYASRQRRFGRTGEQVAPATVPGNPECLRNA